MSAEAAYLNVLPLALVAADASGKISYLNPAAEMLFGTSTHQAIGQDAASFLHLTDVEQALADRAIESGEEVSLYERPLNLPQGHMKAALHITPMPDGELLFTLEKPASFHSLTASEWKKETTRAAGVMAAMLAHEVKNPLSGIRGAAQILREEIGPEQQPMADLICVEADRIRDLLAQVDIFANVAPEQLEPVNIHEVLQHVMSVAAAGFAQNVKMTEQYDPSLPGVMGNRDLLIQLFLNLIKNSAEALHGQKNATITLATAYRSGFRLGPGQRSLPVVVSIGDNGPGIPEKMRSRLFEPFVSSKEEGRGLGLAVVAKIAADLGAVVELDESARQGAKFDVLLPCAA